MITEENNLYIQQSSKVSNVTEAIWRLPAVKYITIFCFLIIFVNTAVLGYRSFFYQKIYINEGRESSEKITNNLADHTQLTFLAVDVVLKRATERYHFDQLFGGHLNMDTVNNITNWVNETPQISAMLMADERGNVTAIYRKFGNETWMESVDSIRNFEMFKYHIDDTDMLYIGKQADGSKSKDAKNKDRQNNGDFILLSRRLDKVDGSFGGVVVAAVTTNYINGFFRSLEGKTQTKFVIKRDDGEDLINNLNEDEKALFQKNYEKYYVTSENSSRDFSVIDSTNTFDSKLRIYSFRDENLIKIMVAVVSNEDDIFARWKVQRMTDFILYVIFLVLVLVVMFFTIGIAKQMYRARISERAALTASKAKSDFLANMSHELRTPLNAIIGFSEMMNAEYFGKLNDKQKERLQDIHSCGTHLLSLINDVLEFSKGQAGKIEIRPEEFTFQKVAKEAVRIFEERAVRDGKNIVMDIPRDLPYIIADKRKVKQILLNLISNSVKFTERGDVIQVSARVNDKNEFVFSVKDTGAGMDEKDIPKALSAFGQVHHEKSAGGTGLGLPLCKVFAELHGGRLELKSKKDVGTEVLIYFPPKVILSNPFI
jgi:signal transduction histidine kinase